MDYLGSQARAAQLFHKDHPFLTGLEQVKMILTLAIVYFAKRTWEIKSSISSLVRRWKMINLGPRCSFFFMKGGIRLEWVN